MPLPSVAKEHSFTPNPSKRRRRHHRRDRCKFLQSWLDSEELSNWLQPIDNDRHKAYCSICDKVFSISHGGVNDATSHRASKRHSLLEAATAKVGYWKDFATRGNVVVGLTNITEDGKQATTKDEDRRKNDFTKTQLSSSVEKMKKRDEKCMSFEMMHQKKEFLVRKSFPENRGASVSNRERVAAAVEGKVRKTVEVEKQSQNPGISFWPSENLEDLVEAEDVREIDEYEDSDILDFEKQLDECSDRQIENDEGDSDENLHTEQTEEEEKEEEEEEEEEGNDDDDDDVDEDDDDDDDDVEHVEEEEPGRRFENVSKHEKRDKVVVVEEESVPSSRMLREHSVVTGTPKTGAQTPTMSNMFPQQYCLRWKYHHSNLQTMFSQLLERQAYCDVTLACEGQTLRAHKVVLSACSTYFDTILSQYEEKDPIVIMRDVKFSDIKVLVEFMYKGEINIDHTRLSSLLKTAEDLHIKGLAEVSWRSDSVQNDINNSGHSPGAGTPGVETVLREGEVDEPPPPKQRRRGRPPLDDPPSAHDVFTPKITCITGNIREFPEEMMSEGDHESCDDEMMNDNNEPPLPVLSYLSKEDSTSDQEKKTAPNTPSNSNATNPAIPEQFREVIKMNDYLTTGRRQEFWEEPFTRRVMDAIKSKELEMKSAAEILGVSYGTLYGRYRDSYGCLKHPYRVRDFWSEPGPADVLAKLRRKEISLFRAAEFLNVTVHTLATYLSTLQGPDRISLAGELSAATSGIDVNNDIDNNEAAVNEILQKFNANASMAATPTTSATIKREGGGYLDLPTIVQKSASSVLENNPDITIVKTECSQQRKREYAKVSNSENNNAKLMSGGAVSEISQQQQKLSDTLSLNNDNGKP